MGPHLQHLRHLRDLNLKGNPCVPEICNDNLDIASAASSCLKIIKRYLPSLVYFNDVKISKATIDDNKYVLMPHNKSYYNILDAFDENESTGQLHFELNQLYQRDRKFLIHTDVENIHSTTFLDKINCLRPKLEAMWNEYLSKAHEQKLKLIQTISCHEKYLVDVEQDQLRLLSNLSEMDELKIDNLIEKEISFGEKLSMKWSETSDIVSNINLYITNVQNHFNETVHTMIEKLGDMDPWNVEEKEDLSKLLNKHIHQLFHEGDMRRNTLVTTLQDLSDTWYCRHRARFIEISRMRP